MKTQYGDEGNCEHYEGRREEDRSRNKSAANPNAATESNFLLNHVSAVYILFRPAPLRQFLQMAMCYAWAFDIHGAHYLSRASWFVNFGEIQINVEGC